MAPTVTILFGGILATYLFLRFLLHVTQDAREPPTIVTGIPFLSPLIGMIREKSRFYLRLRDTYGLPIYTLRLPFSRMYVVNATELIPILQQQWRTVSFAAIAAGAGGLVGMSEEAVGIMHQDLKSEHGFSLSWPKYIMSVMGPGRELDAINRKSIEIFAADMERLRTEGTNQVGPGQWLRQIMVTSTTEAIWGPQNPYRDAAVAEAWKTFEAGFLTLSVFPLASLFSPKLYRARELAAAAMIDYMRKGGHETASGLVRKRYEHHRGQFGLSLEDFERGELGNTFAVLGNSTPCASWVLYHIFSDDQVLNDVRREVSALVRDEHKDGVITSSVDLVSIRTSCPIFLSTFQETLRYRAVNPGPRVLLEDVLLDGAILLKKGSMLMIPAPVQHTAVSAWGVDAHKFDYMRFACKWSEPMSKNSPIRAGFPILDEGINVKLRPRDASKKWHVTFSGSDEAMEIVSDFNTAEE